MSVPKWYIWRTQCQKWHSDAKWQLFRQASITGVSMSNQTQIEAVDSPKRRGRGRFRWLGGGSFGVGIDLGRSYLRVCVRSC